MTYTRMQLRLGTTAITAVLALSATPLAAQEVPSTDTPVEATTTTVEPAPVADPLAPVPEADAVAPEAGSISAEEAESSTAEATEEAAPAPVAKKAATKTARTAPRAATKASAPATASTSTPVAEGPAAAAPAAPTEANEPAPQTAPVEEAVAQPSNQPDIDEAIPLAGGAGAVILALAGAGMAVRRKRRRDEETIDGEWTDEDELALTDEVEPVAEPAWDPPVHQPKVAPLPASMATPPVSDDFDRSKFGRHVQAAYAGPTPGNPSLSLRKRLKLAGELDRRERMSGTALKPAMASKPVIASMDKSAFSWGDNVSPAKKSEYQF